MHVTINQDVHMIAEEWRLDERLVQAVVNAEGNIVRAVQCSVPTVVTRVDALDVLCRSLVHAMQDYVRATPEHFVEFFGARWAPLGAGNDPTHLNEHWVANVFASWIAPAGTHPKEA